MAWSQVGTLKGPKGDKGDKGDTGADGKGISIAGSVATYADLPGGLGAPDAGKGYLVLADGLLYIWSGSAFPANGAGVEFKGDKGDKGDQGIQGVQGNPGSAATVAVGTTTTGAPGTSAGVSNSGSGSNAVFDFTIPQGAKGDKGDTGSKGDKGDTGNTGNTGARGATWFNGTGAPTSIAGQQLGDFYLDTADGTFYKLS